MENKEKLRLAGYAGIVLFLGLLAHHCGKPHTEPTATKTEAKKLPPELTLKPEEKAKIVIDTDNRRVTVVSSDKIQTFTGVRHATIIEEKDGSVELVAKQYGWCLEPGVGVMVSDHAGVAADLQVAYWKTFGINIGGRLWPAPVPFLALSYNLGSLHLANTSVLAGIDWRHYPCLGLRVRL